MRRLLILGVVTLCLTGCSDASADRADVARKQLDLCKKIRDEATRADGDVKVTRP